MKPKPTKKPTDYPNASFRIAPDVVLELTPFLQRADGNTSAAMRDFVNWSVKCLQAGRTELHNLFTLPEWRALAECFQGTFLSPPLWPYLHYEWREADESGKLREKWGVDGNGVAARLHGLSPAARWAFCHALMIVRADVTPEQLKNAGVRVKS